MTVPAERPRGRKARGFSIIEALWAFVIVALAIVGLFGTLPYAFGMIQTNSDEIQAYAAGQQFMDTVRNAQYNGSPVPAATTATLYGGQSFVGGAGNANGTLTITPNGCPNVGPFMLHCTVTVSWNEQNSAKSIQVESYVVRQRQ